MLGCNETPLAWPAGLPLSDVRISNTSGITISANNPGSLQILTRRTGTGVGDGVNIVENSSITLKYREQQYIYEESVFHVTGLHIFPGQTSPYSGEYHIHMSTSSPTRKLTLVIPLKQIENVRPGDISGNSYFSACSRQPVSVRPPLQSILPMGSDMIIYMGPEIRGRTANTTACNISIEHAYLLVLTPVPILASDLYRIRREGSASEDTRDLPAPHIVPSLKVDPIVLKGKVRLAKPGLINPVKTTNAPQCTPPVIEETEVVQPQDNTAITFGIGIIFVLCFYVGIVITDFFIGFLWSTLFSGEHVKGTEPLKGLLIGIIMIACLWNYSAAVVYFNL